MTSLRSSSTPSTVFSSPSRRDLLKLAGAGAGSAVGLSLLAAWLQVLQGGRQRLTLRRHADHH